MALFKESGYLRPEERAPKEPLPRIMSKGCAVALLVAVALPTGCVFLALKDQRERPAKIKTFEKVCQTYPVVDQKGAKALDVLYQSVSRGEVNERDVSFKSGAYNSGSYEPFPHAVDGLSSRELRILVSDLTVNGRRLLTLRNPELVLPNRIGVSAPETTVFNCKRNEVFAILNAISKAPKKDDDRR